MELNRSASCVRLLFIVPFVIGAPGCVSLPDAKVQYYLPRSEVGFKVVRTFACDANDYIYSASAVTPSVKHVANRDQKVEIDLATLKGVFSDSDVKFDFYEDGRLKNFNATNQGQGEAALKTVFTLAAAIVAAAHGDAPKPYPTECVALRKIGGDKPVSLTYEGTVSTDPGMFKQEQNIPPDAISEVIVAANTLQAAVGSVCAFVDQGTAAQPPTSYAPQKGDILLKVREPGRAKIAVTAGGEIGCKQYVVWDGELPVSQLGKEYELPIPPPTVFGKRTLGATFLESGALSNVQFASTSGAGQALNVMSSAYDSFHETTLEKANALKAEADLLLHQQRLLVCQTDPKNCK